MQWLAPHGDPGSGGLPAAPGGVEREEVAVGAVPFRKVAARMSDDLLEHRFTAALRDPVPDAVHLTAFGSAGTCALPWIADRMGVPLLLELDLAESVCHRGSLVDWTGARCGEWGQPERCLRCCTRSAAEGLGPAAAVASRLLQPLGGLSPYPSLHGFRTRLDVLRSGIAAAPVVLTRDEAQHEALGRLGVPETQLHRVASDADLLARYPEFVRLASRG